MGRRVHHQSMNPLGIVRDLFILGLILGFLMGLLFTSTINHRIMEDKLPRWKPEKFVNLFAEVMGYKILDESQLKDEHKD